MLASLCVIFNFHFHPTPRVNFTTCMESITDVVNLEASVFAFPAVLVQYNIRQDSEVVRENRIPATVRPCYRLDSAYAHTWAGPSLRLK